MYNIHIFYIAQYDTYCSFFPKRERTTAAFWLDKPLVITWMQQHPSWQFLTFPNIGRITLYRPKRYIISHVI